MHQHNVPMDITPHSQDDNGSFLTGFLVGAAAGAVGLFFFGTKRGKEVYKDVKKEWAHAREKLKEEYGEEFQGKTIGESLHEVLNQVNEFIEKDHTKKNTVKPVKTQKKRLFFRSS